MGVGVDAGVWPGAGIERVLNVAACLFIIIMIKTGVSNSLLDYKQQGEAVIHNYYTRNLDEQLFNEIFPEDPPLNSIG